MLPYVFSISTTENQALAIAIKRVSAAAVGGEVETIVWFYQHSVRIVIVMLR